MSSSQSSYANNLGAYNTLPQENTVWPSQVRTVRLPDSDGMQNNMQHLYDYGSWQVVPQEQIQQVQSTWSDPANAMTSWVFPALIDVNVLIVLNPSGSLEGMYYSFPPDPSVHASSVPLKRKLDCDMDDTAAVNHPNRQRNQYGDQSRYAEPSGQQECYDGEFVAQEQSQENGSTTGCPYPLSLPPLISPPPAHLSTPSIITPPDQLSTSTPNQPLTSQLYHSTIPSSYHGSPSSTQPSTPSPQSIMIPSPREPETIATQPSSPADSMQTSSNTQDDSSHPTVLSPSEMEWKRQKDTGEDNDEIDEIMGLTGLEDVKAKVLRIKAKADVSKRQGTSLSGERFNIVLLGNPGTGQWLRKLNIHHLTKHVIDQAKQLSAGSMRESCCRYVFWKVRNSMKPQDHVLQMRVYPVPSHASKTCLKAEVVPYSSTKHTSS